MKGAIVVGGHVQGLGITRIYGRLGFKVIVMDNSHYNLARHSRYCSNFYRYSNENLLDTLIKIGKTNDYSNFILIPTNDRHIELISRNKQELSNWFIVGCDDWSRVKYCYNKRDTYNLAKELNISIARTWMPDRLKDIDNAEIEFPCIIKPAVMHSFYSHFKQKVFVCNNRNELVSNYNKALAIIPAEEIIVQEIIKGDSGQQYSACFLFDGIKAINSLVARRARQHPADFGNATTFAQIVEIPELIKISEKLLRSFNYRGICEVEYKYDVTDNQYKLLEINPRTWKWHTIAVKGNIPMLENYYNLLLNQKTKDSSDSIKVSFRHLVTDIPMVIIYRFRKIYKRYPVYPIQYAVWDKSDISPALFELLYLPILFWKR